MPNAILCKRKLTSDEYAVIRQHSFYTYRILSKIKGFEQIAEWAAAHHERLDGLGYPEHLFGQELDLGSKIIAVADVATAIAERRPYRDAGSKDKVINALTSMVKNGLLEPSVVELLIENYDLIIEKALQAQEQDELRYQQRYAVIEETEASAGSASEPAPFSA